MKVELICIGTELLNGKINTNVGYIGERLSSIGLDLNYETSVGDNDEEIKMIFQQAIKRSDIIIATGGLGPTFDDLTRESVAKVLGRSLTLNREILSSLAAYFVKRGVDMPKNNERQAYLIDGAKAVVNTVGTAPGQLIEIENGKKCIILLPGPPKEMQAMFDKTIFPYLKKHERGFKKSVTIHVCGDAESVVDEKIEHIVKAEREVDKDTVSFAILAHQMIIDVKVSVSGKNEMLIDEMLGNIKGEVYEALKENIYGEDKKTLESVVGELMAKNKKTLSAAESCTGGALAYRLTNIPGSSMYFKEGIVAYSNESKMKNLGVNKETLATYGAVSAQVALEMAEGMRNHSLTDYSISVTGIAGPSGGTQEKPVGLIYIGICGPIIKEAYKYYFTGNRSDIRQRSVNQALDLLRRQLLQDTNTKK